MYHILRRKYYLLEMASDVLIRKKFSGMCPVSGNILQASEVNEAFPCSWSFLICHDEPTRLVEENHARLHLYSGHNHPVYLNEEVHSASKDYGS